jgi:hypothetical protein
VYSCLWEDFYGDNDECFIPATLVVDATTVVCSLVAKVQQYAPCDTVLDIPNAAVDAYCTAITGWYDTCEMENVCDVGGFDALIDPLFIDFDHCYSNPVMDQQSISFWGKDKDDKVQQFNLIVKSPDSKYMPSTCDEFGKCQFSKDLRALRKKFLKAGKCEPTNDYYCLSEEYFGDTDRCFVPATVDFGDNGFHCSMVARVEQFDPCVKSAAAAAPSKSSGGVGFGDLALRTLFVLAVIGIIWFAYKRGMPILNKRRARMNMKSAEDDEDEVIMVARGGNVVYKDNPAEAEYSVPSGASQIRSNFGIS